MGSFWSYGKISNEPDPITGLTAKERHLVTSSFNIIKKDITGVGIQLFIKFFDRKPEYQNYFPFKDIPRADLPQSSKFKTHAVTVMYAVASIIDNLENGEVLVGLLQKTAESHAKRNLPPESFDVLQDVLVELIDESLGSKIGKEGVDAWRKTLAVAFKVINDTLGS